MATGSSTGFPREAIEACLDRIVGSRHFSRSLRLGQFLRFTVESLVEGRADELKERTIGIEVYGRPLDYDSRTDPIVRSEAHRLRARLDAYYAREGAADPVVIELPKGSYVPELHPNTTGPGQRLDGCRLIVGAFEDRCPGDPDEDPAGAIERALRTRLADWPGLRVVHRASGARGDAHAREHLTADYRVEGTLERDGGRCAVTVRLLRLADEKQIWSHTGRFAWERPGRVQALAEDLATSIGSALGGRATPSPSAKARAFDLYVKGRHGAILYGNALDPRHLSSARRRLEAALEQEPGYVDAAAELANLELLRLYPPRAESAQILASARALLERALASEPRHARSLYLLGHVEGSALRPREGLRLTESAVAADPEDPEGRTMLAVRYASLGFWESAVTACDWALALDPVWEAPHRIKLYLLRRMGRLEDTRLAIEELVRSGTSPTEVAIGHFDLRIAEGDIAGAQAALASLEHREPLRPDQKERLEIARGLAEALEGRHRDARRKLEIRRNDGPRFWDHAIRLALVLGEAELALELLEQNPINRSYRWLASEPLAHPHLPLPRWRTLARDLHESWLQDLEEVGPRLPAPPPVLPEPADLLPKAIRAPIRGASIDPASPDAR